MKLLYKLQKLIGIKKSALEESVSEILENDDDTDEPNEEKEIIENLVEFKDLKAYEVMVPRTEVISAARNLDVKQMAKIFLDSGHTRIPIHRKDLDDVIGFVHVKDLVKYLIQTGKEFDVENEIREILYVPRAMKVSELLKKMKSTIIHIAIVLDEYGGTDGIITIGDLIAEIVGDIQDEHDESIEGAQIVQDDEGYIIDSRAEIELVEEMLQISLAENGEYETVGGFILEHLGRIPKVGEKFRYKAVVEFEVLEAEAKKIKKVHMKKL